MTLASLAVNRALFGAGPAGFHAVNVALHALASALAYFAARAAGASAGAALVAGLLFAVHPIHSEAVAGVVNRSEILAALGVLGMWLAHRRARGAPSRMARAAWIGAAGLAYGFGLLSKESAAVAPLLPLLDDALERRHGRGAGRAPVRRAPYAAYVAVFAAGLALRGAALGGLRGAGDIAPLDNPAAHAAPTVRAATALALLGRYAILFLWPARLSSDYSFDAVPLVGSVRDPALLTGLAVTIALAGLIVHGAARSRAVALGAAIWLLFLVPVSNLIAPIGVLMAERLAYLPSLGGALLVGAAWASLAAPRRRLAATAALALLLAALASRTAARNADWKDNATLALHDVRVMPRSTKLQAGAAIVFHEAGDTAAAERHYREAIRIAPDFAQMRYNLGVLLYGRPEGIEELRRAADLAPTNPLPRKALAEQLERAGRTEEALEAYTIGASLDPDDLAFRFERARANHDAGRADEARAMLSELAGLQPASVAGRRAAALLAEIEGRPGEAAAIYRALLEGGALGDAERSEVAARLSGIGPLR